GVAGTRAPPGGGFGDEIGGLRLCCPGGLEVCRRGRPQPGLAWFTASPLLPPVHAARGLLRASLSGCGRASVHAPPQVRPGCGGAIDLAPSPRLPRACPS